MARSSSPPDAGPAHAKWIWPLTLVLIAALGVAPLWPLVDLHALAAAGYVLLAAGTGCCAELLRRRQVATDASVRRLDEQLRRRDEELVERDRLWRAFTENEAERVRLETEHTLKERVPAVLRKEEVPDQLHDDLPLADGLSQLVDEVAEGLEDREESQRLALVELANRVQTSAHRIQASVTGMANRYPADADLLEISMAIDHAATQQARHAQSLKVLCGEWPGQQWQRPLALVDVVRAASGRILAYRRVEVTGDPDVGVAPTIVEPLIHLIAELLANATEYSPPKTGVPVTVRTVQRGAVVEVDDGGLGLDEYRLSEAREIVSGRRPLGVGDVGEIPQTGFAVVGRFARRHDFHVDVGPSPYGGVRAVVLVPSRALETLAPIGTPAHHNPPAPPPAPSRPQAAPPALPAGTGSDPGAPGAPVATETTGFAAPPASDHTDTGGTDTRGLGTRDMDTRGIDLAGSGPDVAGLGSGHLGSDPLGSDPLGSDPLGSERLDSERLDSGVGSGGLGTDGPAVRGVGSGGIDPFGDGAGERRDRAGSAPTSDETTLPSRSRRRARPTPESSVGSDLSVPGARGPERAGEPSTAGDRESSGVGNPNQAAAEPASQDPPLRSGRRLPRRRSRRGEYAPATAPAPAPAAAPPGTPEEAGDWMNQFFAGGREGAALEVTAPAEDGAPSSPSSPRTPDLSEGQT